jgi:hypothetical protein
MNVAPIVLFVYKRPVHTRRVVESLQKNELAGCSDLFVFSDGPKSDADAISVTAVREYVETITGFKSVTHVERDKNFGLAQNVIQGVTEIISQFGKVVVVEDDIVCSPYFLDYMNKALREYRDNEQVMHISGYMFPIDPTGLGETFFYRNTSCWGWATWKRAWDILETDTHLLMGKFSKEMKYRFNIEGSYDYWKMLDMQRKGEIDSWAIRWYASVFLADGLSLHPSKSLTNNIGLDGTGVHCSVTDFFCVEPLEQQITQFVGNVEENRIALGRIKKILELSRKQPLGKVVLLMVKSLWERIR